MILKGSQRGGGVQLAQHLMNDLDNDHIELHEMRGFVAADLTGAFKEIEAISRGTRCKQYLFSLSLNPPELANAPPELFEAAINSIEANLKLSDQPRAVIFHEKNGRRHAHCVWSRIDANQMRSINLPHFKMKLQDIARELYLTHEWELPEGFKRSGNQDALNYGSVETQQAKRVKRDPKAIKAIFKRCWEQSDSRNSFAHALAAQGYILAKGDRRGFIAVDMQGEIYSISRWTGIKTKDVRARMGLPDGLPSVAEAMQLFEARTNESLTDRHSNNAEAHRDKLLAFTQKRLELVKKHRQERKSLAEQHQKQLRALQQVRQEETPKGLKAIWRRVTRQADSNSEQQAATRMALIKRHTLETQRLITDQLAERRQLQQNYYQLQHQQEIAQRSMFRDLDLVHGLDSGKSLLQSCSQTNFACVSDPNQPLVIDDAVDKSVARQVGKNPEVILDIISRTKESFSRNDIVRGLAQYIENPTALYLAIEQAINSNELVEVHAAPKQQFSTKSLQDIKSGLRSNAVTMAATHHAIVSEKFITAAIKSQNNDLKRSVGAQLSDEQEVAIRHLLKPAQLSLVTGYAGAGKSTMLKAAAKAWQHSGYNVVGAALSGKAADGLEKSSGIGSSTLASLEKSWENGYRHLTKNDVLVIDEAGMVDLRQMARIVEEVKLRGTKLVLVGDAEQLQPIQAGTPFRDIEQLIKSAKLSEIRRQSQGWQRKASILFAQQKTIEALALYQEQGRVQSRDTHHGAIASLVEDYMNDVQARGVNASRLALAHRRKDVHLINQSIRHACKQSGLLSDELKVTTDHGARHFSVGDRIVLTKNDRELALRNGMLGSVTAIQNGELIITLDGDKKSGKTTRINPKTYASIDHGYATTIHKSQGATVQQSFILGSTTMDRHLTYVAMTRHHENAKLYLDQATHKRLLPATTRNRNRTSNFVDYAPARH